MSIEPILAEEDKLLKLVEKSLEVFDTSMVDLNMDDDLLDVEIEGSVARTEGDNDDEKKEDGPIVKFVNKMLFDAIKMKASELHFEPYEKYYRVRFRVDGMLREIIRPPLGINKKIAARIKVMSRLDVAEKRVPQDGRIKLKITRDKSMDFHVSICPTLFGEKIVIRIWDSCLNIDILGYEEKMPGFERQGNQKGLYLKALENPYGMVLVTGPTGSGKTVSLYTGVNILNKEGVNISTIEKSMDINLPGINQMQINNQTDMSYEKNINSLLQNSDVILIDELDDSITCNAAVRAAMRCFVLSALYAEDAPHAIFHILTMGVPPFFVATSIKLIIAQRLCRRLCSCKVKVNIAKEILSREGFSEEEIDGSTESRIPPLTLYMPGPDLGKICERCENTGYRGRIGIFQVMPISDTMKHLIIEGRNVVDLADQAQREGIPDLRQSGLKKVKDGITSLEEINRVIPLIN